MIREFNEIEGQDVNTIRGIAMYAKDFEMSKPDTIAMVQNSFVDPSQAPREISISFVLDNMGEIVDILDQIPDELYGVNSNTYDKTDITERKNNGKLVFKLFEEFKNDINVAKLGLEKLCDIVINASSLHEGNLDVNASHNYDNDDSWFTMETEIIFENAEDNPEDPCTYILDIKYSGKNSGGKLRYAETRDNPAEYDDDDFKFDIDEVSFSRFYDIDTDNDIDILDVTDIIDTDELKQKLIDVASKIIIQLL